LTSNFFYDIRAKNLEEKRLAKRKKSDLSQKQFIFEINNKDRKEARGLALFI